MYNQMSSRSDSARSLKSTLGISTRLLLQPPLAMCDNPLDRLLIEGLRSTLVQQVQALPDLGPQLLNTFLAQAVTLVQQIQGFRHDLVRRVVQSRIHLLL